MRTLVTCVILSVAAMPLFTGCDVIIGRETVRGNGHIIKQDRPTAPFDELELQGSMDVYVTIGAEQKVTVETDENIQPFIELEENAGELAINQKDNTSISTNRGVKVYVTTPKLENISLSGTGNIYLDGKFVSTDRIKFSLSGSGNLKAREVDAPIVEARLTGSGNIYIKGKTRDVEVDIEGSADFMGEDLLAENAKVNIAGSGDAHVYASLKIDANIAGSGDVKYRGNAPTISSSIAGSGSVKKD